MMKRFKIAVVGATGNVGREVLAILAERDFPACSVDALASDKSVGSQVSWGDKDLTIGALSEHDFAGTDLVFFCASTALAEKYIPQITAAGATVIDKSSAFRLDPDVPLCVPEVNLESLGSLKKNIIASPNCIAIPLAVALKPLAQAVPLKRIVVSTYQSVSGAGTKGMDELHRQTRALFVNDGVEKSAFPKQIAFNVIPHIDKAMAGGHSGEEEKVILELKKLLTPRLKIAITCVRVPVFIGHALSVCVEFDKALSVEDARAIFKKEKSLFLYDKPQEDIYMTPLECAGDDHVFISRLRKDSSVENGLSFWVATDNLRKGAALNAVQIGEMLLSGETHS